MEEVIKNPPQYGNDIVNEIDTEIEDPVQDDNDSIYYSVSSFGADYTVDGLVKRLEKGQIIVPDFQRHYVWDIKKASRFIESLIIGLPVPGVFLSRDAFDEKSTGLLIIDGQQRLLSLQRFYKGFFGEKRFRLTGVCKELEGHTYEDLSADDQGRLDDAIIHATIIKQESPDDNDSSIYLVFERLNTGGLLLQPQEIRACIYHGKFNALLNQLVNTPSWRSLFKSENTRMKEQELILRFFALFFTHADYKKGLKHLLNSFMSQNRDLQLYSGELLTKLFVESVVLIVSAKGKESFKRGSVVNAALFDSIMIGVAKRLQTSTMTVEECRQKYDELVADADFIENSTYSTADEKPLKERIKIAINKFSNPS